MKTFFGKVAIAALLIGTTVLPSVAAVPGRHHGKMTVNARLGRQNARINEGLRTKKLTYQEGSRLKHRDARIHAAEMRDRRHHHGRLTAGEHRRLEGRLNRVSRSIYREKHERH